MRLTLEELLQLPPDDTYYLSYPLIPRGGMIVIGGAPKSYKSMLAINMAYDLAEGAPLWGIQKSDETPLWPVKKPLKVLYVEKEIGVYRLKERFSKIDKERHGSRAADLLFIEPKGNKIYLDSPEGLLAIKSSLDTIQPDVLILDPMRSFHRSDEDSSTEMSRVFDNVRDLQSQCHDLTTIMVHHAGKIGEPGKGRKPGDMELLRGSSDIFAEVDTAIMLYRHETWNDKVELHFRVRSGIDPNVTTLYLDMDTLRFAQKRAGARYE